jgi:hypothetical protein
VTVAGPWEVGVEAPSADSKARGSSPGSETTAELPSASSSGGAAGSFFVAALDFFLGLSPVWSAAARFLELTSGAGCPSRRSMRTALFPPTRRLRALHKAFRSL